MDNASTNDNAKASVLSRSSGPISPDISPEVVVADERRRASIVASALSSYRRSHAPDNDVSRETDAVLEDFIRALTHFAAGTEPTLAEGALFPPAHAPFSFHPYPWLFVKAGELDRIVNNPAEENQARMEGFLPSRRRQDLATIPVQDPTADKSTPTTAKVGKGFGFDADGNPIPAQPPAPAPVKKSK